MIRKIHLDFHTNSDVRSVGGGFDPEAFAATLTDARVNALATPGKCQYGYTYYDTRVGTPHPGLVRADLFPATVRACAARGIRVQAYFTLGLDDVAAERHPDWRQRYRDGTHAAWGSRHICFASPYTDEIVIPEALDMLARCPGLVGFWFDICLYCNGAFYSPFFERAARSRLGAAADDEARRWQLGRELIRECCLRIDAAIRARLPDAENYFNSLVVPGEPENIALQPVQEVENPVLFHSPERLTTDARWLRWHAAGRAPQPAAPCRVIGLVSRFQGPWMDPGTLRTPDQLRFDVARVLALGCDVSMGDHRHPDGTLDAEVYRRIGAVYAEAERLEPVLAGATPCREALLLTAIERGAPQLLPTPPATTMHAARLLEELGIQFDIAGVDETCPAADLVLCAGDVPLAAAAQARLREHVARGGALLLMGDAAGLEDLCGIHRLEPSTVASPEPGAVSAHGHVAANPAAEAAFARPLPALGLAEFAHLLTHPGPRFSVRPGTEVLAERLASVSRTPPCAARAADGSAIVQRGRVIYCAGDLFAEHMATGAPGPRELLGALCARLLPQPLVRHDAGATVVAHLHRSPGGHVLHLVQWALDRWSGKTNPAPMFPRLGSIEVCVRLPQAPRTVRLPLTGTELPFHWADGRCSFTVPHLHVWAAVDLA